MMATMLNGRSVTAEFAIMLDLFGCEDGKHFEVVGQVRVSQRGLCGSNACGHGRQGGGSDDASCKLSVKFGFFLDQALADLDRLRLHRGVERFHVRALSGRQVELF